MGSSFSSVQSPQTSGGKSGGIADQVNPPTTASSNPTVPNLSQSSGKGGAMQGSQGKVTLPSQGGQPEMGMPNAYSNTIGTGQQLLDSQGSWDNSPKPSGKGSAGSSGKGKGA
jgi:hypothetical protein